MDMRQFQDCRYFLQGKCTAGGACPFAHDEAKAAKFQAALQSGGGSGIGGVGGPLAGRPQQDCYFFSIGQCRKGGACPFRHDPSKVAVPAPNQAAGAQRPVTIEDKLSKPLDATISAAWQPQHSSMDPTLILQLPASPVGRSAALGRGHPAAGRSHPAVSRALQHNAAAARDRGGTDGSLGSSRTGMAGGFGGEGPRDWGLARPDLRGAAQPAVRAVVQRLGRPSSAGREPSIRQPESRSNVAAAMSIEAASPPKRRSVLDRLGPRLGDPSSDSSAPSSSRHPAARADDSDTAERPAKRVPSRAEPLSLEEAPAKRLRPGEAAPREQRSDGDTAKETQPTAHMRNGGVAPKLLASARLGPRAAHSSGSADSAPKRPSLADAGPLESDSGSARRSHKAPTDMSKLAAFAPPKSREELRKEKERAALAQPLQKSQSAMPAAAEASRSAASGSTAAAPAQPVRKRTPIPAPGQQQPVAAKAIPAAPAAKPTAAPARQALAPAKVHAPVEKRQPAGRGAKPSTPKAAVKANDSLAANSTEFAWNVEGIEDAEDDFENDLDLDADVDVDADVAADAGGSNTADFDKELAEFENAFD